VVGGCDTDVCGHREVRVYDPDTNTWSSAADYPVAASWLSCGTITGQIYCAGGTSDATDYTNAYTYNPATNAWSPIASLPVVLWASGYTAANGMLLVSGGITDGSVLTNVGYAYDPVADAWSPIPNSNNTLFRGGSACGFYKIGGSTGRFNAVDRNEVLPGFDDCETSGDVPWLSESPTTFTVAPGTRVQVTVTLDAADPSVTQPGDFAAKITFTTDTPYAVAPVGVTMSVTPPKTWGKIAGIVVGAACTGGDVPIAGATVQIDTWANNYTLFTEADGTFALWLDKRNNPLTVIVAKDGWQPQTRLEKIKALQTTESDWRLLPARPC
jgi:hypothetical protein